MDRREAEVILGILPEDDFNGIKKKYRRQMGQHHPDAVRSEHPDHVRRAQQINEAYRVLKENWTENNRSINGNRKGQCYTRNRNSKYDDRAAAHEGEKQYSKSERKLKKETWKGELAPHAFTSRNIYVYYSMDTENAPIFRKIASGKYRWDPQEEEFELFLRSVQHASRELLIAAEEKYGLYGGQIEQRRFRYQVRLFEYLALQFIDPLVCLGKLVEPERVDEQGRAMYRFRAFLAADRNDAAYRSLAKLQKQEMVFPAAPKGSRLQAVDRWGELLGHLSLEQDALYFCVVPLLKAYLAQVKLTVRNISIDKRRYPEKATAELDFWFRLNAELEHFENPDQNGKIRQLLAAYENGLRQQRGVSGEKQK